MAPEENAGTELLLQGFDRRFLAARTLRSFPWQSLEAKLRDPSDSELLRDILQKPSGGSVTLSESTAIISHGTTGLVTWDATLQNGPSRTRTVLELGSGAGLTGLAICKMCHPWAYIFSDPHRNVLLNGLSLEADITANLDSPRVTVDVAMVHQLSAFQPDIVIAADMLYCPEAIVSLVGVLWRLAACQEHKRTPEVYMAFTVHNPETCQLFTTKLAEPPRRAGIRWEAEAHHDQKLLPYGEHLETAMLNLTL
uniref:FAM86 N-terminal domain-containing protein n=1 Tax=Pan paniscus TaxID=9597 RepID=A0A2R8ZRM4_PANPA